MSTEDFIIELFCRVDDVMKGIAKHSQASLYPSEVVTLALLFALNTTPARFGRNTRQVFNRRQFSSILGRLAQAPTVYFYPFLQVPLSRKSTLNFCEWESTISPTKENDHVCQY